MTKAATNFSGRSLQQPIDITWLISYFQLFKNICITGKLQIILLHVFFFMFRKETIFFKLRKEKNYHTKKYFFHAQESGETIRCVN